MTTNQAPEHSASKAIIHRLGSMWQWLTEPTTIIKEPDQRRQARLLASLLLALMFLSMLSNIGQSLTVPGFGPTAVVLLGTLAFLAIAYGLSRTKYYRLGALSIIVIPTLVAFVSVLVTPADTIALAFVPIGVLLSSIFCSMRTTIRLAVVNIAGMLLLPAFIPEFASGGDLSGVLSFNIIMSVLIVLATHHRNLVEKDRQLALTESEERFRQIAENIGEVFWMASPDMQQVLYVSPSYEQIWGRPSQILYERPFSLL